MGRIGLLSRDSEKVNSPILCKVQGKGEARKRFVRRLLTLGLSIEESIDATQAAKREGHWAQ